MDEEWHITVLNQCKLPDFTIAKHYGYEKKVSLFLGNTDLKYLEG